MDCLGFEVSIRKYSEENVCSDKKKNVLGLRSKPLRRITENFSRNAMPSQKINFTSAIQTDFLKHRGISITSVRWWDGVGGVGSSSYSAPGSRLCYTDVVSECVASILVHRYYVNSVIGRGKYSTWSHHARLCGIPISASRVPLELKLAS